MILVEGINDVASLLRAGYDNALAIGGGRLASNFDDVKAACKSKGIVVFMDGDAMGKSLLEQLRKTMRIHVALQADDGTEVEDLGPERVCSLLEPNIKWVRKKFSHSRKA